MEKVLSEFKIDFPKIISFMLGIVLPLTIWFIGIKHSIDTNALAIAEVKVQSIAIEKRQELLNDKILMKLERISEDVAEIKGVMKSQKP